MPFQLNGVVVYPPCRRLRGRVAFYVKMVSGVLQMAAPDRVVLSIPIMFLSAESVKELPAATVYAAFVGIGTAGTAIIGMAFFGESSNAGRVCCSVPRVPKCHRRTR